MFFNINNNKCFLTPKLYKAIFEGSRDTENNGWKFNFAITEIKYVLKYITIVQNTILNCNNI